MRCSERRRTTNKPSSRLHQAACLARIGNKILSVLTILVLLIGSVYCFYCLFDDWRQSQAGLPSQMAKFKPDADDPLSFEELLKLNPDVIGWITIDKTHIDQPIVQGKDDLEYINKSGGWIVFAGGSDLSLPFKQSRSGRSVQYFIWTPYEKRRHVWRCDEVYAEKIF